MSEWLPSEISSPSLASKCQEWRRHEQSLLPVSALFVLPELPVLPCARGLRLGSEVLGAELPGEVRVLIWQN